MFNLLASFFLYSFKYHQKSPFYCKKSFIESLRAANLSLISDAFYTYSNLSVEGIRCIIHVEGDSAETIVKTFTNNIKVWSKIKLAANYRTAHTNQSKYLSITESLPDTFNPCIGYHSH